MPKLKIVCKCVENFNEKFDMNMIPVEIKGKVEETSSNVLAIDNTNDRTC